MDYSEILYVALLGIGGFISIGLYVTSVGSRLANFQVYYVDDIENEIKRNLYTILIYGVYILSLLTLLGLFAGGLLYIMGAFK